MFCFMGCKLSIVCAIISLKKQGNRVWFVYTTAQRDYLQSATFGLCGFVVGWQERRTGQKKCIPVFPRLRLCILPETATEREDGKLS